mmetsp:Transcript_36527/g.79700  ORF Transcript_36527/g.79700 Transcript_36527/m.79700 type:complete len:396 (-) Transcript_36527:39-1226(-)
MGCCMRTCCWASLFIFKVLLLGTVGIWTELYGTWAFLTEWHADGPRCEHPPKPNNNTGLKILVASFAKMGTTSMGLGLANLGFRSYHYEDLMEYVWTPHANEYWSMPEHGGRELQNYLEEKWSPELGTMVRPQRDAIVLNDTSDEKLAAIISQCQPDSTTFDGFEKSFWRILKLSPDAKVISLNWRTHQQVMKSLNNFGFDHWFTLLLLGIGLSSQHVLPWGLLAKIFDPMWDALTGDSVARRLREGGPGISTSYPAHIGYWHAVTNVKRVQQHWHMGLQKHPTEEEFYQYFEDVRKAVPKERLIEFDLKKHTYKDLCAFLDVHPCPRDGLIKTEVNLLRCERNFPIAFLMRTPLYLFFWWVHFKIIHVFVQKPLVQVSKKLSEMAAKDSKAKTA